VTPTLIGYSAQGFAKFGFYEIFKDVYKGAAGANAAKYQTYGFLLSSACAEIIADCLLCPFEAVRYFSLLNIIINMLLGQSENANC
jgi:solute carrier family 25 phosphate transporter 3